MNDTRFLNQRNLLTKEAQEVAICVIGAGAIGSFVVLALSKMGYKNIEVWDADKIEDHNFANQMFPTSSLGMNKADATVKMAKEYSDEIVTGIGINFTGITDATIVVLAVDSMKTRKEIFESIYDHCGAIIDARMGGQFFRVFTVDNTEQTDEYRKQLYTDAQASQEVCGSKSIIYTVMGCAAAVCNQVRRISMDLPTQFEINQNYNIPEEVQNETLDFSCQEEVA